MDLIGHLDNFLTSFSFSKIIQSSQAPFKNLLENKQLSLTRVQISTQIVDFILNRT